MCVVELCRRIYWCMLCVHRSVWVFIRLHVCLYGFQVCFIYIFFVVFMRLRFCVSSAARFVCLHVSVGVYLCFVCLLVYLYTFMQMHAYRVVCMNVLRNIDQYRIYICIYIYMYIYICIYIYMHIYVYTYICIYIYMHIHILIYIYYLNSHLLLDVFLKKQKHENTYIRCTCSSHQAKHDIVASSASMWYLIYYQYTHTCICMYIKTTSSLYMLNTCMCVYQYTYIECITQA